MLFDNGLDRPIATLIAEGIIELLEPLRYDDGDLADVETGRGPYLGTLVQFPADPPYADFADRIVELLGGGSLPACAVVIGDAVVEKSEPNRLVWVYDFRVHCISGYPGEWVFGRLDPSDDPDVADDERRDPGVRAIMQHVVEQLSYRAISTITPNPETIRITAARLGMITEAWSSGVVLGQVRAQQSIALPDQRNPETVVHVQADHDIESAGVIASQRRFF